MQRVVRWNELTRDEQDNFAQTFADGNACVGDANDAAMINSLEARFVPFAPVAEEIDGELRLRIYPDWPDAEPALMPADYPVTFF